jgi:Aerotolerance regulator N-terminal
MIWLNPIAFVALASAAAPILIHILVQRRAPRMPFPTLRFIAPTRLAAIRRHLVEDAPLLLVRIALLSAAVAALAGPLIVTAGRRAAWSARVARAIVIDAAVDRAAASDAEQQGSASVFRAERFEAASLGDGLRLASAWLETVPPARREVVVVSPLALGSLTAADVAGVPAAIGIRFERRGTFRAQNEIDGSAILASGAESGAAVTLTPRIVLNGPATSVNDAGVRAEAPWPLEIQAPPDAQPAIRAVVSAVLADRVRQPNAGHRARLRVVPDVAQAFRPADVGAIRTPWIADAVARIARDRDLQSAAARLHVADRAAEAARHTEVELATAADGTPIAVAAESSGTLIVVSAASATDLFTPLLARSIVNSLSAEPDLRRAEVVAIPDGTLQSWSRPAPSPEAPRLDTVDQDDRRWLWLAALALLALETGMRRSRATPAARDEHQEAARVA